MTEVMKVERVPVASLTLDPSNARKHSERNINAIASSLQNFGQRRPLVVWGETVIAGNGTLQAADSLGWKEVDVTRVPVEWTEEQARAYALADNRTAELAEWNTDVLAGQLIELDEAGYEISDLGFDPIELNSEDDTPAEDESVFELPTDPVTKLGDVWVLGDHRIICGDCREPSDVQALLQGHRVGMAFTSPPYAEQRKYDESSQFRPVHPDDYVQWFRTVSSNVRNNLADDGSWFINIKPASRGLDTELYVFDLILAHVREWGWHLAAEFCWERSGVPGKPARRFKNQFEPIYQFAINDWKFRPEAVQTSSDSSFKYEGIEKDWNAKTHQGKKSMSGRDIFEGVAYPGNRLPTFSGSHEALGHGAAFPVGLPEWFMKAYTDEGDIVYDPFIGTGSTLIAAERTHRKCYGVEISPAYCDIIIQRWETLTGNTATKENPHGTDGP